MSTIDARENTRRIEQTRLDALKSALERNKLGQFATPPVLALEIAKYAKTLLKGKRGPIRFLDPAIGTGSFFAATLDTFPQKRIAGAAGIEIDSAFAKTAEDIWGPVGLTIINGDFTKQPTPSKAYNLILTNPPYVRHHHLQAEDKVRLQGLVRSTLGIEISGLAGLYCHFLLLSHTWLEEGGLAVWLIPSEFMDVNYGVALKHYLLDKVTLVRIHRFCPSDVQFDDALVSSAVVVFRKTSPPPHHAAEFTFGGSLTSPRQSQTITLDQLMQKAKWTSLPTTVETPNRDDEAKLGDLFSIKRGLATGDNSFFILPVEEAERFGIPQACLRPILPSPRYLTDTIVESSPDGYPKIDRLLGLIDCRLAETEIQSRYPLFWKYLCEGKDKAVHLGYLASRRTPWYSQERRDAAPFLCTYMGRINGTTGKPFRFIWNKSNATAANVYLLLYPKPILRQALAADPGLYHRLFDAMNEIEGGTFISEGRVYGGGLHKVEPAELANLPCGRLATIAGLRIDKPRSLFAFL